METDPTPVEGQETLSEAPITPPAEAQTATETAPAEAPTTPTWQAELEKLDAKELRKMPKVAGIIGGEIQRAIQAERERIRADEGTRAARQAEESLRRLATEDPVTFAERWLSDSQKQDIQRQLDDLRGRTRHELATNIGRAMTDVPEWKELSEEEHEELAKAVLGKSDDEVIPIFNRQALNLVATRRAKKLLEAWQNKDLPKIREAIRAEEAAKLLKGSDAPDPTRPKGAPANVNIASMSDSEFDAYWNKTHRR